MKKYYVMPFVKVFVTIADLIIILEVVHRLIVVLNTLNPGNLIQLAAVLILLTIGIYLFFFLFRFPIVSVSSKEIINNIPFSKKNLIKISEIEKVLFYNSSMIQLLMTNKDISIIKIHLLTARDKNNLIGKIHELVDFKEEQP